MRLTMSARRRTCAVLLLPLLLVACSGRLVEVPQASQPAEAAGPVWPAAPEAPRVAFVHAFSRPADLGIGRGLLQRLRDLVLGGEDSRMVRPMAVVATEGTIYVADPGVQGVHRFAPAAGGYELIRGPGERPLPSPVGLAVGGADEVYVADSKLAQVLVIRPGERSAAPLPLDAALGQPTGIAFDARAGRLFVVDTTGHRILVFGRDGRLQATIGRRGEAAGEFNYPTMLWWSAPGRLYVTDTLNFRIQILDADGRLVGAVGRRGAGVGDAARPKGVAVDRHGHLYVVDALLHSVQIFDEAGRFLLPVGQQGQERGEFWLPTGIFVGDDDRIYVADTYNRRVQVLRYVGGSI